jgi:GxxExxY protein
MEGFVMLQEEQISYAIQGCVFEVYRQLGCGFLEKVYEKSLLTELALQGLQAQAQVPVTVRYKSVVVGEYFADIVVENCVILELKAQQNLPQASKVQLLNYLKATGLHLGMLVNFAFPKASVKRVVL